MVSKDRQASTSCRCQYKKFEALFPGTQDPRENYPIGQVLKKPYMKGIMVSWEVKLSEYDI